METEELYALYETLKIRVDQHPTNRWYRNALLKLEARMMQWQPVALLMEFNPDDFEKVWGKFSK